MVSWVLAWWVQPSSLKGSSIFLEEMGLVGFCFVGSAWLWDYEGKVFGFLLRLWFVLS